MTVHVTIELTEEQKARLDAEAGRRRVEVSELLLRAAEELLEPSGAWIAAVQEGRADVLAGRLIDHDQVVERAKARAAELLAEGQDVREA